MVSVDLGVVVLAEERQVVEGGWSAVDPVFGVMGVAPLWGAPAAGLGAAFVADP